MTPSGARVRGRASKAFWAATVASYPFIAVLPPALGSGWLPGAVVAWLVLSMPAAAFIGFLVAIFFDDSPKVSRPTEPADDHLPWLTNLKITAGFIAAVCILTVLIVMLDEGFGAFTDSTTYGVMLVVSIILVLVVTLTLRFATVNKSDVARKVARRRARRGGRPRDLALLAGASHAQRSAWYRSLRWRARRAELRQMVLGLPMIVVALVAGVDEIKVFPAVVRAVLTILAAVFGVALLASLVRSMSRPPVLLVGRVTKGLYGVEMTAGQSPGLKELAWNFVTIGASREVTLEVSSASSIAKDGTLRACPRLRGKHDMGGRRKLITRAIEGERAVIVCASNGPALGLLGDLIRQ